MRVVLLALAGVCGAAAVVIGQAAPPDGRPIFRVTTSLVQIDAVVTDKQGRHVTTLGPEDFEVYQGGKARPVTTVAYVNSEETWVDTSGLPPLPPEAMRPADARRVIVIVVDDLRLSFSSMHYARRGLLEFIDEQFQPGDLGALVTTSGGPMRSRSLTFHRTELRADISRLRFSLWGVRAASVLEPFDTFGEFDALEGAREHQFATSAIAALYDVVENLRRLPGRKSIVLVSEGFTMFGPSLDNSSILHLMQRFVDRANRAGVVVYALDPRGLVPVGITAADRHGGRGLASARAAALRDTQDSLRFIAGETGGFAVVNSNDLAAGMRRILADQAGYYLIGYEPAPGTLGPESDRRFWKIKLKVKRKGLKVRTRSGFYGIATR